MAVSGFAFVRAFYRELRLLHLQRERLSSLSLSPLSSIPAPLPANALMSAVFAFSSRLTRDCCHLFLSGVGGSLLSYLLLLSGAYASSPYLCAQSGSPWLCDTMPGKTVEGGMGERAREVQTWLRSALVTMWTGGREKANLYNPHLWLLPHLLSGMIGLFFMSLFTLPMRTSWKLSLFSISVLYCLQPVVIYGLGDYASLLGGMAIGFYDAFFHDDGERREKRGETKETVTSSGKSGEERKHHRSSWAGESSLSSASRLSPLRKSPTQAVLAYSLSLSENGVSSLLSWGTGRENRDVQWLGLMLFSGYVASFPLYNAGKVPLYHPLLGLEALVGHSGDEIGDAERGPDLCYRVGAILMLLSISQLSSLRAFLSLRLFVWLGNISLSMYLIHGPLLWSFGAFLFRFLHEREFVSYYSSVVITSFSLCLVTILLGFLFSVKVESKLLQWSAALDGLVRGERGRHVVFSSSDSCCRGPAGCHQRGSLRAENLLPLDSSSHKETQLVVAA